MDIKSGIWFQYNYEQQTEVIWLYSPRKDNHYYKKGIKIFCLTNVYTEITQDIDHHNRFYGRIIIKCKDCSGPIYIVAREKKIHNKMDDVKMKKLKKQMNIKLDRILHKIYTGTYKKSGIKIKKNKYGNESTTEKYILTVLNNNSENAEKINKIEQGIEEIMLALQYQAGGEVYQKAQKEFEHKNNEIEIKNTE